MFRFSNDSNATVFEFTGNLKNNSHIKVEMFAESESAARHILQNINNVFKAYSLDDLVNAFGNPVFDGVSQTYSLESYKTALKSYQENIHAEPFNVASHSNRFQTEFGRRFSDDDIKIAFVNGSTNRELCALYFKQENVALEQFPSFLSNKLVNNFGDKYAALDQVKEEYMFVARKFLQNYQQETNVVKMALEFRNVEKKLNSIFTGDKAWVPEIYSIFKVIKNIVSNAQKQMLSEAKTIENRTGATEHGITGLMYAAARCCPMYENFDVHLSKYFNQVENLLALGVDVNAQDKWGYTALCYIAFSELMFGDRVTPGREAMTLILLDAGAKPEITDFSDDKKTALDYFLLDGGTAHGGIDMLRRQIQRDQKPSVKLNNI